MRGNNLFALFKTKPKTKYNINRKGKNLEKERLSKAQVLPALGFIPKPKKRAESSANLVMRCTSPAVPSIWFCQMDPVVSP